MSTLVGLAVMGTLVVSVLAWAVRGTRAWWIPGALLLFAAVMTVSLISGTGGDVGGIGALANGIVTLGFMGLLFLSLVAFVIGGAGRATASKQAPPAEPEVTLATATVVRHRHPHPH